MSDLNKFSEIVTKDGSISFHNNLIDESYHSNTGAMEESFLKFAKVAVDKAIDIGSFKQEINVLDLFFGVGYNSLALMYYLFEFKKLQTKVNIDAVERDEEIFEQRKKVFFSKDFSYDEIKVNSEKLDSYYKILRELITSDVEHKIYSNELDQKINVKVHLADVFDFLKTRTKKYDLVFFDAFSIRKQPELWTEEMFNLISKIVKKNSILVTYSCSRVFRQNAEKSGFKCFDGPCIGRKSPSTFAIYYGSIY